MVKKQTERQVRAYKELVEKGAAGKVGQVGACGREMWASNGLERVLRLRVESVREGGGPAVVAQSSDRDPRIALLFTGVALPLSLSPLLRQLLLLLVVMVRRKRRRTDETRLVG